MSLSVFKNVFFLQLTTCAVPSSFRVRHATSAVQPSRCFHLVHGWAFACGTILMVWVLFTWTMGGRAGWHRGRSRQRRPPPSFPGRVCGSSRTPLLGTPAVGRWEAFSATFRVRRHASHASPSTSRQRWTSCTARSRLDRLWNARSFCFGCLPHQLEAALTHHCFDRDTSRRRVLITGDTHGNLRVTSPRQGGGFSQRRTKRGLSCPTPRRTD